MHLSTSLVIMSLGKTHRSLKVQWGSLPLVMKRASLRMAHQRVSVPLVRAPLPNRWGDSVIQMKGFSSLCPAGLFLDVEVNRVSIQEVPDGISFLSSTHLSPVTAVFGSQFWRKKRTCRQLLGQDDVNSCVGAQPSEAFEITMKPFTSADSSLLSGKSRTCRPWGFKVVTAKLQTFCRLLAAFFAYHGK